MTINFFKPLINPLRMPDVRIEPSIWLSFASSAVLGETTFAAPLTSAATSLLTSSVSTLALLEPVILLVFSTV
jgi:hypothetical protein